MKQYFSFHGRIGRMDYLWVGLMAAIVLYGLKYLGIILENMGSAVNAAEGYLYLFVTVVVAIAALWASYAVSVQRLHDLNWSGWWALILLIPVADFILALILLFKKGTTGKNPYGSDPLVDRED